MHLKNLSLLFSFLFFTILFYDCTNEKTAQATDSPETIETIATTDETNTTETIDEALYTVNPPLQQVDVQYKSFDVQASKARMISLDNGTTIDIPANTFVTKEGEPVSSPVEIKYREFHNAAEIIASGIPMIVRQEDGTEAWMQTAGMFEIKGFANEEEVFIAEDKAIQVNMASSISGTFDFWYLNPQQKNWERKGSVDGVANPARTVADNSIESNAVVGTAPVAPVAYDNARTALNFNVDYAHFPELRKMKGIVWQYASDNQEQAPENNEWIYKEEWTDIALEEGEKEGTYQLKLESNAKEYSIPVYAGLRGTDLEQAQAAYKEKLAQYKKLKATMTNKQSLRERQRAFTRSFAVNDFGIHNYDILLKQAGNIPVMADFEFEGLPEAIKQIVTVYLVTGARRTVVYLPHNNWKRFAYNPDMDNEIVAILPDNKIATFMPEDFEAQRKAILNTKRGETYTFKMKVKSQIVESVEDLDAAIAAN